MLTIASNVILRGRWSLIGPDRPGGDDPNDPQRGARAECAH